MDNIRLRYPFDYSDGRLCTIQGEAEAVRQLLGMVRDLAPGDFPGVPELQNCCDLIEAGDRVELLPTLRKSLQQFFTELRRPDVIVESEAVPGSGAVIGYVLFAGEEGWRFRVPVRQGDRRVILDLDAHEEN